MFVPRDDDLGAARQGFPFSLRAPQVCRVPACEKMISPVPPARIGLMMRPSTPDSLVVGRIQFDIMFQQQLGHEPEDDCRTCESGHNGQNNTPATTSEE